MTDKEIFEKLEAEIERLENYENESVTSSDTRFGWIHGKTFALTSIRVLLDSMQKEPKECMYSKDNFTDEDRKALCDGCEEECKFKPTTSVWHDGNEKPLNDKYVLAYIEPGYFEVGRHAGVIDSFYYGSFATDWEHIIKWAHIDDILKL